VSVDSLRSDAPAKLNLALVVGPRRGDGKHEVVTLMQALELADTVEVQRASAVAVHGFADDTIVGAALEALVEVSGVALAATITKRVPVAAGLGGGSSDAATALRLGNELLGGTIPAERLHAIAATLGADVPFFLGPPQQLATADGARLTPVVLPDDYVVLLALPYDARKESTAAVYAGFDERDGEKGFAERRRVLLDAVDAVALPGDLARLPPNDLAASPLALALIELGALRADVSGAGPAVYGLFRDEQAAARAQLAIDSAAETLITRPRRLQPSP